MALARGIRAPPGTCSGYKCNTPDFKFCLYSKLTNKKLTYQDKKLKSGGLNFLKVFLLLRNYGIDFQFSGYNRNIECAFHLRWPVVPYIICGNREGMGKLRLHRPA